MFRFERCIVSMIICISGLVSGCTVASSQEIPEGWRLIEFDGAFSFTAPESVRAQEQQIVDSLAGTLSDERIEILYDYGWYSSPLTEYDDQLVSSSDGNLDGRPAKFIETESLVAVHVPTVFDQTRFTMIVQFNRPEDRELGRSVIATVRFQSEPTGAQ